MTLLASPAVVQASEPRYDLVLRAGHVIDAKNGVSAVLDVALAGGRVAAVAEKIDPAEAARVLDVAGLFVTPGLVDIHAHVYAGTGDRDSYAGDNSVYPDGFTYRSGVTTIVDAGGAGWRNFEDFRQRIIRRSNTRVLAFLNIVGHGMRGELYEQDLADMQAEPTAEVALRHPGLIVGIKTAHYAGADWSPVERAVEAGERAGVPVMVDFGLDHTERPVAELLTGKLRPGDIYTHMYSGLRQELEASGRVNPGLWEGRKRGIVFDVGHGGGSFVWRVAVPAVREGFVPDCISTDLHINSMNAGMKNMLNVMSKFLALGLELDDVVKQSTWNPAQRIGHEELGHLSVGAPADLAVLRLEKGDFGFVDSFGARLDGSRRVVCELTVHGGKVVYDLNGLSRPAWDTLPPDYKRMEDAP
jgi:dihydroorotase